MRKSSDTVVGLDLLVGLSRIQRIFNLFCAKLRVSEPFESDIWRRYFDQEISCCILKVSCPILTLIYHSQSTNYEYIEFSSCYRLHTKNGRWGFQFTLHVGAAVKTANIHTHSRSVLSFFLPVPLNPFLFDQNGRRFQVLTQLEKELNGRNCVGNWSLIFLRYATERFCFFLDLETAQHYVTLPPNIRNLRDKSLLNPHGEQNRRSLKRWFGLPTKRSSVLWYFTRKDGESQTSSKCNWSTPAAIVYICKGACLSAVKKRLTYPVTLSQ